MGCKIKYTNKLKRCVLLAEILVTGGAGCIGSHFLEVIQKRTSSKIIVIDNLSYAANLDSVPSNKQIEFVWCDINKEEHVDYIFKKHRPTKVYHFAAESHVDKSIKNYRPFLETNVIGTINLLNAFLLVGIEKFNFICTDEVDGSLDHKATVGLAADSSYNNRVRKI